MVQAPGETHGTREFWRQERRSRYTDQVPLPLLRRVGGRSTPRVHAPLLSCAALALCAGCRGEAAPAQPTAAEAPAAADAEAAPQATTGGMRPPDALLADGAPAASAPASAPQHAADGSPNTSSFVITTDAGAVAAAEAQRILHVGDSMVPLVGNYLRKLVQSKGRKYHIESVISSSTLSWDNERLLQEAMYKYDPDLILISLGSNELFDPEPERRAPAIRRLVEDTRGRPCLWIGPPAWKKDKGIIEVIKSNLGHCRYFDSVRLNLERMADGRHPSWNGGYHWASAVWKTLGGAEEVPTGSGEPR